MDILEEIHIEHINNQLSRIDITPTKVLYSIKEACIIIEYNQSGIKLKYGNDIDNNPYIHVNIKAKICSGIMRFNKKYDSLKLSEDAYLDNLCSCKQCVCNGGQFYRYKCSNARYFTNLLKDLMVFINMVRLLK